MSDLVDEAGDGGEMHHHGAVGTGTEFAIKIPIVHPLREWNAPLAFDVFADFVLGGLYHAVAVFAFDVEFECFFHACLLRVGSRSSNKHLHLSGFISLAGCSITPDESDPPKP